MQVLIVNSLALYGSYSYQINPTWTTVLGLRYSDIQGPCKESTRIDTTIPIESPYQ